MHPAPARDILLPVRPLRVLVLIIGIIHRNSVRITVVLLWRAPCSVVFITR